MSAAADTSPYLIEVVGPDHGRPAVFYRTVVYGFEAQQDALARLQPTLYGDWQVVVRPLGELDAIVETMRSQQQRQARQAPRAEGSVGMFVPDMPASR